MALDEDQLAMVNTLIYQEDFGSAYSQCLEEQKRQAERQAEPLTMGDLLGFMNDGTSRDDYLSDEDYRTLIETMASDTEISSLTIRDFTPSGSAPAHAPEQDAESYRQTGINLTLSDKATGDLYIVYKGTQDASEWQDNFEGLLETDTDSQRRAAAYADLMIDRYGTDDGQVIVSGHSKGGNKAMYVTVTDERVDTCYSFDGQGFGTGFHQKYAAQIEQRKERIYAYNYEGDFVSSLLIPVAGTIVFTTSDQDSEGLGLLNNMLRGDASFMPSNHAPFSLFESSDSLTLKDGGAPKDYWETINDFTMWVMNNVPERHQRSLVDMLALIMGGGDVVDAIESHPEEFGVLVGTLADYPNLYQLLREMLGTDLDLTAALGNPVAPGSPVVAGVRYLGTNALLALLVRLLRDEDARGLTADGILSLLGADVDEQWVETFRAAGSDVRDAIASGERAREAVLMRQTEVRDWSDARKQELLDVVASVEAEPWYDFTRWEATYWLQDVGAELGLWDCERDANEIIRRQIDCNDVSKSKIQAAFARAEAADEQYAIRIQDMAARVQDAAALLRSVLSA